MANSDLSAPGHDSNTIRSPLPTPSSAFTDPKSGHTICPSSNPNLQCVHNISAAPTPLPTSPLPGPQESPTATLSHYDSLVNGFNTITLAVRLPLQLSAAYRKYIQAGFIAAIQGQLMSTTISTTAANETGALRAVNAFFAGGLVLDIMAAILGYLTGRWLQRLTEEEKTILDADFTHRNTHGSSGQATPPQRSTLEHIYYTWMGLSLFVPMPLLFFGVMWMMAGIYTYIWTQHSTVVAVLVTLAGCATIPFVVGDFYIGRNNWERRRKVIRRLSEMQGSW